MNNIYIFKLNHIALSTLYVKYLILKSALTLDLNDCIEETTYLLHLLALPYTYAKYIVESNRSPTGLSLFANSKDSGSYLSLPL